MTPRYAANNTRLTDCCGAYSSYCEQDLCCKACFHVVPMGQGDGSEQRVDSLIIGQTYFTRGMDMNCFPTVEAVVVVERVKPISSTNWMGEVYVQDCVTESDGVRMLTASATLFATRDEVTP